jgi:uncharacterized membrane protein YeaQ/YmgE (transglycosylase-associated protein family)
MCLVVWIVLGLIAGLIASKAVNTRGEGVLLDSLLGVVGAVVGGVLFRLFGLAGVSGVNPHSVSVAMAGAILVLIAYESLCRAA